MGTKSKLRFIEKNCFCCGKRFTSDILFSPYYHEIKAKDKRHLPTVTYTFNDYYIVMGICKHCQKKLDAQNAVYIAALETFPAGNSELNTTDHPFAGGIGINRELATILLSAANETIDISGKYIFVTKEFFKFLSDTVLEYEKQILIEREKTNGTK